MSGTRFFYAGSDASVVALTPSEGGAVLTVRRCRKDGDLERMASVFIDSRQLEELFSDFPRLLSTVTNQD